MDVAAARSVKERGRCEAQSGQSRSVQQFTRNRTGTGKVTRHTWPVLQVHEGSSE